MTLRDEEIGKEAQFANTRLFSIGQTLSAAHLILRKTQMEPADTHILNRFSDSKHSSHDV
jgi:hypothetical protein